MVETKIMKKSNKTIKQFGKCFFISLFFTILFSATAFGQNNVDTNSQTLRINTVSQVEKQTLPNMGPELNEMFKAIFECLVTDDDSVQKNMVGTENNERSLGIALTSSYINNQLSDGMKIEFHANPMVGGGSILLKKIF